MMSEQELSASSPTKKLAGNIHLRNQRHDDDDDEDNIDCSSVGLLRSALGSRSSSRKRTTVGAGNRMTSLQTLNHLFHATIPAEVTPAPARRLTCGCCGWKPIYLFRGGVGWDRFELDCDSLHIDLFWPTVTGSTKKENGEGNEKVKGKGKERSKTKEGENERCKKKDKEEIQNPFDDEYEITISDDEDDDILPLETMAPLCNFRNLRFLRLTGMSQSYQMYIWQAVWLNPGLEELELEMALEPCIRRAFSGWPYIKGGWIQRSKPDGDRSSYYGDDGQGILHRRVGIGEYLDKYAIAHAKVRAAGIGSTLPLLPIVKLSLTGFVVDADPFRLFNPHRLRLIDFKNDCVDAGFALPDCMREQVVVYWPKLLSEQATVASRVKHGEIKLIDLGSKAKKLADTPADCPVITAKATAETTTIIPAEKSEAKGDTITATPNFSYPNPHAPVASPKRAAKCSATAENTGKDKGMHRDGNKLSSTDMGDKCKNDVKPQHRMRLFLSRKKAKR
ncbi:hypothetical protein EMCG_02614 [[Emmonsia] crescens]|uniref:Uncharacterized protein n=1 Tax=[Emmonsia] crescens TaxID=73230 RepID=A0A0G2J1A4_9EURO|nr:hypothetical protein EMCG_02614 [Emmonsia crescens UAMH 3008]